MGLGKKDLPSLFSDAVGKCLEKSVLLRGHSQFKIGGKADYFFDPSSFEELGQAIRFARELSLPYYIIGGGSNIFFDDEGFRGLIIRISLSGINRTGEREIMVHSGTSLKDMLQFCVDEGLGGLEFLAGIPGTVGGAVYGNAGAFGQEIGSYLKEALLFDEEGREITVDQQYFDFGYRQSLLRTKHEVIFKAVFNAQETDKGKIRARIDENLMKRKEKHPPWDVASAGSYFKNSVLSSGKKVSAAYFLDQIGAKNLKLGDAAIYSEHSNFIINLGNASAQDVLGLASELKRRVKEEFGVELEEEVIFLPARFSMP